jgi:hypothetical protein
VEAEIVRNCPFCELRFEYHNEVVDHIIHDHPTHRDMVLMLEARELPHR